IGDLKSAYEVRISQEAEKLEERLAAIRQGNEERVAAEERQGRMDYERIKAAYEDRIRDLREKSEMEIQEIRNRHQEILKRLDEQAKKSAKRLNGGEE